MQILNNVGAPFFPLNSTRSTSNDLVVRVSRDKVNSSGTLKESNSDILFDSVFLNRRKVPALEVTGPLAAFRVIDAISFLSRQAKAREIPIVEKLSKNERFTLLKLRQLDNLSDSLNNLSQTVSNLLETEPINPKSSSSSRSTQVEALVGKNAPLNSFEVTPVRLSQNAILVSDEQSTPLGTLGLSGSFFINGTKITAQSSDTLFDLKNKINFGEDQNRNGVLDKMEDVNNNGTLDIIQTSIKEFVPAIFIAEDLDGDGKIDPNEDANENDQLDGGTSESKVLALVQDNRLILVGSSGGDTDIDLLDEDDVLLNLGFFELNSKGFPVQKEFQFDVENVRTNLIQKPQTAKIEINGNSIVSETNVFSGVIEDTSIVVKSASTKTTQINTFIDAESFFIQIKNLFDRFNDSIIKVNDLLGVSRTFVRDRDIQDIRNDLTFTPQKRAQELQRRNEGIDSLRGRPGNPFATGVGVVNKDKNSSDELVVTSRAQAVKFGIVRAFQNGDDDLLRRLGSIGLRNLEDNTFLLDEKELRRGLVSNTTEVFDLFTNSETGILPSLDDGLRIILKEGLGELAIEESEVAAQSRSKRILAENFRDFSENTNLERTLQTLIVVA